MENQPKHILLFEESMIILRSIKHRLKIANISSFIKSNTESARLAGFLVGANDNEIYIDEKDAIAAKKILENFLSKKN
jgi:hypothetical protein